MNEKERTGSGGGIAPFGYRWDDGKLVIDKAEAPVRKLIYELFIKHRRKKTVARLINDLGHRTRRGSEFYDTTILRLLTDTTAKGQWMNGDRVVKIEPIISSDLWERANRILSGDKPARQAIHLFQGLTYCDCGGRMLVVGSSPNYACADCRRKISINDLEEIVSSKIADHSGIESHGIDKLWSRVGLKDRRVLIEQICSRITVGSTEINIEFFFGAEDERIETSSGLDPRTNQWEEVASSSSMALESPLLSEAEASRFLDVSTMTLLRRRKAGKIGFFRVGNRIRYSKEKHLLPFLMKGGGS